jgi:hypothetical protein
VAIDHNPTLEPLFRYTNKEVQGTKFVDMLSSIVANINSPDTIFKKIAELAGAQVMSKETFAVPVSKETCGGPKLT